MILRKFTENAFKLLFVLLLCLSLTVGHAQDQNNDEEDRTPITITEVASTEVAPSVPAAGTVFSRNETQITAGMAGRLEWLAEPGDYVEAGTLVAAFDCEMLELQKERQLAEADRAEINFEMLASEVRRFKSVSDTNVIAEIQLDRTAADRDLAGSDLRIAKITIRETDSKTPILLITAHGSDRQEVFDAMEAGASDYLLKPFDATTLREKLKKYCFPEVDNCPDVVRTRPS